MRQERKLKYAPEAVKDETGKVVAYIRAKFDHRGKSKSKYRNQIIDTPDGKFHSKAEYARWCDLKLEEQAGAISELRRQVKFELLPKWNGSRAVYYIADYVYKRDGKEVVEDHKGAPVANNRLYLLKKRLMLWRHNIEVVES